jgi:hypothetical protein
MEVHTLGLQNGHKEFFFEVAAFVSSDFSSELLQASP